MDRQKAGVLVLILFAAAGAVFTSSPFENLNISENPEAKNSEGNKPDSQSDNISNSDFAVEVREYMIHIQEMGDNDVLANTTVNLSENASEGAVISYVVCTDCSTQRTAKVIRPGESRNILYEYNLENQSDPFFDSYSINYVPLHRVPEDEVGVSLAMSPRSYVENEEQLGKLSLDLPNQTEIENKTVTTITEDPVLG